MKKVYNLGARLIYFNCVLPVVRLSLICQFLVIRTCLCLAPLDRCGVYLLFKSDLMQWVSLFQGLLNGYFIRRSLISFLAKKLAI